MIHVRTIGKMPMTFTVFLSCYSWGSCVFCIWYVHVLHESNLTIMYKGGVVKCTGQMHYKTHIVQLFIFIFSIICVSLFGISVIPMFRTFVNKTWFAVAF